MTYTIPWDAARNAYSITRIVRDSDSAVLPLTDPGYLAWAAVPGNIPVLGIDPTPPAAPPTAQTITSFVRLMELFTQDELNAMVVSTDPQVRINIWQAQSAAQGGIKATDASFIGWVSYLQSAGILTQLRAVLVGSLIPPQ